MASLIVELIGVLNNQAENYEQLLALSQEKKDVIIANDVETLQKITFLENTLVNKNQKLEKSRIALIKDIAIVLNKKETDLTLSTLATLILSEPEHSQILEVRDRMKTALDELSLINEQNHALIVNALEYIEFSVNVLKSTMETELPGYTKTGMEKNNVRGVFDKKQ